MLSWGARRQLTIVLVLSLALFFVLLGVYYLFLRPQPNCFDASQNQDELGVDCGGRCARVCAVEVSPLINFWTRVFRISDGVYDVGALVENPNAGFYVPRLAYTIRVYDDKNIPLAERTGITFVNSKEQLLIFEPQIPTGNKIPVRAVLQLQESEWMRVSGDRTLSLFAVENKRFETDPSPRLSAELVNMSQEDLSNIAVSAVAYDKDKNVLGVSSTHVDGLGHGARVPVVFTWPESFSAEALSYDILPRLNAFTP